MAIIRKESSYNVVEAARIRVKNIFNKNNVPVYLAFSGGKDSLALAQVIYSLIQEGEIDASKLTVQFIDEEGIFPCVEKTVKEWRQKFLLAGAKFDWYCIEVLHFNCLNMLEAEETFICWDSEKKDRWIREMPKFAITDHPLLRKRKENYQTFVTRISKGAITLIGNRVAESMQRLFNVADKRTQTKLYPIYDWSDADVWKYLQDEGVKTPEVYEHLWRLGVPRSRLRVSQFFSNDTVGVLVRMNEFYPDLMKRVTRREPNAYLVAMYWDSEMFGRSTAKRRKAENNSDAPEEDYEALLREMFRDIPKHFTTPNAQKVAAEYKKVYIRTHGIATKKHYKKMYEALLAGDPKKRTLRGIFAKIYVEGAKNA